jgi:hypothetical protein
MKKKTSFSCQDLNGEPPRQQQVAIPTKLCRLPDAGGRVIFIWITQCILSTVNHLLRGRICEFTILATRLGQAGPSSGTTYKT